jgi:uncharacterized protein YbjT (DUF2867 family)
MKILIAGAFGNLGREILRTAVFAGHKVTAVDTVVRDVGFGGFTKKTYEITNPKTMKNLAKGMDVVISTIGLTNQHKTLTHMDVDYQGNKYLLEDSLAAGVKKFIYVSIFMADKAHKDNPLPYAKHLFEEELKASGIPYIIYRPTGYFQDIVRIFNPMVEKGKGYLLLNARTKINVVATQDLGLYIVTHLDLENSVVDVGGNETYRYRDIGHLFFSAAGKKMYFRRIPAWYIDVKAMIAKVRKTGEYPLVKYTRWILTHDLVSENTIGGTSLKEHIETLYQPTLRGEKST